MERENTARAYLLSVHIEQRGNKAHKQHIHQGKYRFSVQTFGFMSNNAISSSDEDFIVVIIMLILF